MKVELQKKLNYRIQLQCHRILLAECDCFVKYSTFRESDTRIYFHQIPEIPVINSLGLFCA